MQNGALSGLHAFCSKVGELGRRVRSWPFDPGKSAFCTILCALSDAPISVANGHDLTLLPSSPTFEQKCAAQKSAALRCGVSDLALAAAPLLYVSKVVTALPSPQGHAKSLLDAVKTYAFASVLEGFWPKRTGNQRPRPPHPFGATIHFLGFG